MSNIPSGATNNNVTDMNIADPASQIQIDPNANQDNPIKRIYNCVDDGTTITLTQNENRFFDFLNRVHSCIDMKHDQYDFGRVNARMRKDEKYKNNIQRAIDEISCISKKFTIKKGDDNFEYETKSSAHCLESALERTTLDNTISITIDSIEEDSPELNPLMILPYDAVNDVPPIENAGIHQFELKKFVVDKANRRAESNKIKELYYGTSEPSQPKQFVMDCGARDIFEGLCNNNAGNANKSVAIFSGIMDSSSSAETYTNNNSETQKTFVVDLPFMYLLDQPGDQRININASVGPTTNYRSVQIQFTYVNGQSQDSTTSIPISVIPNISEIPNLPQISDYLANEAYNKGDTKKCIDILLKHFRNTAIIDLCKPLLDAGNKLYSNIYGPSLPLTPVVKTSLEYNQFIRKFFMNIKHWGDKFRAIDAVLYNHINELTFTGTLDTFLMRFICLSNLYGCYANINNNIILNDVKNLTPEQKEKIREIQNKADYNKFDNRVKNIISKQYVRDFLAPVSMSPSNEPNILTKCKIYIDVYVDFFEGLFEKPFDIYAPRGRTVRRLVACVVPPKYVTKMEKEDGTNTDFIFDASDLCIVWRLFVLLFHLQQVMNTHFNIEQGETLKSKYPLENETTYNENNFKDKETEILDNLSGKYVISDPETDKYIAFENTLNVMDDIYILNNVFNKDLFNLFREPADPTSLNRQYLLGRLDSNSILNHADKIIASLKYSKIHKYRKIIKPPVINFEWHPEVTFPPKETLKSGGDNHTIIQTGGGHFFKIKRTSTRITHGMGNFIETLEELARATDAFIDENNSPVVDSDNSIEIDISSIRNSKSIKIKKKNSTKDPITEAQIDMIFGGINRKDGMDVITYSLLNYEDKISVIEETLTDYYIKNYTEEPNTVNYLEIFKFIRNNDDIREFYINTPENAYDIILNNKYPDDILSKSNFDNSILTTESETLKKRTKQIICDILIYNELYQKLYSFYDSLRLIIYYGMERIHIDDSRWTNSIEALANTNSNINSYTKNNPVYMINNPVFNKNGKRNRGQNMEENTENNTKNNTKKKRGRERSRERTTKKNKNEERNREGNTGGGPFNDFVTGGSDPINLSRILSILYSDCESAKVEYLDNINSDNEMKTYKDYIIARINLYYFYAILEEYENIDNSDSSDALNELNELINIVETIKIHTTPAELVYKVERFEKVIALETENANAVSKSLTATAAQSMSLTKIDNEVTSEINRSIHKGSDIVVSAQIQLKSVSQKLEQAKQNIQKIVEKGEQNEESSNQSGKTVSETSFSDVENTQAVVENTQAVVENTQAVVENKQEDVENKQEDVENKQAVFENKQEDVENKQEDEEGSNQSGETVNEPPSSDVENTQAVVESILADVESTLAAISNNIQLAKQISDSVITTVETNSMYNADTNIVTVVDTNQGGMNKRRTKKRRTKRNNTSKKVKK